MPAVLTDGDTAELAQDYPHLVARRFRDVRGARGGGGPSAGPWASRGRAGRPAVRMAAMLAAALRPEAVLSLTLAHDQQAGRSAGTGQAGHQGHQAEVFFQLGDLVFEAGDLGVAGVPQRCAPRRRNTQSAARAAPRGPVRAPASCGLGNICRATRSLTSITVPTSAAAAARAGQRPCAAGWSRSQTRGHGQRPARSRPGGLPHPCLAWPRYRLAGKLIKGVRTLTNGLLAWSPRAI